MGLLGLGVFAGLLGVGAVAYGFWHYGQGLPEYKQLVDYEPPTATRVHAGDGRLIAEYATENRIFVPITSIPKRVVQAFVAAEDQNFFSHPGVDFVALARAVVTNVQIKMRGGGRPVGASTITQQVAKNFLLSNEVSIERKAKEAILALRMERVLSKDRILELYLNEIYLGYGSYGVAAAALNYFDKSMDDLTVEEAAYLAGLAKGPRNYHPVYRYDDAIIRRNYVIGRMEKDGFISPETSQEAKAAPLTVVPPRDVLSVEARYFVEEVRRELAEQFGITNVNEGGLSVRSTLDSELQDIARTVLRDGLVAYDRRHGYRGPVAQISVEGDWKTALKDVSVPPDVDPWQAAVVLSMDGKEVRLGLMDGSEGTLPLGEMRWAREALDDQARGGAVKKPSDVVAAGDVVLVEAVLFKEPDKDGDTPEPYPPGTYALRQIPAVNGGIVALDPHTGRVLAMQGGWSYDDSEFNRATQATRQPGSAIKPFVYLTALEHGFTPATMILDAPFVLDQGPGKKKWKPANFSRKFYGPSPMRVGIERSRNLMTVRLAQAVGMDAVVKTVADFDIMQDMQPQLSMSLGAGETRLLNITTAYAMLVNGGKKLTPTLIDRVQDRDGKTVFRHDNRDCPDCRGVAWTGQAVPTPPDNRAQLVDPISAFQVTSMLEGVVQRGTGRRISELGKPLAGKTGTTNDSRDTWFVGFAPDLAVGVFVGFDTPIPLGKQPWGGQETGSSVAAPIFKAFMGEALKDKPAIPFRTPPGALLVRIDAETGQLAGPGTKNVIMEAFKPGTEPSSSGTGLFIDGSDPDDAVPGAAGVGGAAGGSGSATGLY